METGGSEKERPEGVQGSSDAGDAPHGRPFGGNLKQPKRHNPLFYRSTGGWIKDSLGTAKTGTRHVW